MVDPEVIVICQGCNKRVRAKVTQTVMRQVGIRVFEQIWCFACIDKVDSDTRKISAEPEDDDLDLGIDI